MPVTPSVSMLPLANPGRFKWMVEADGNQRVVGSDAGRVVLEHRDRPLSCGLGLRAEHGQARGNGDGRF